MLALQSNFIMEVSPGVPIFWRIYFGVVTARSGANAGGSLELEGGHDLVEPARKVRDSWREGGTEVLKIGGYSKGTQFQWSVTFHSDFGID